MCLTIRVVKKKPGLYEIGCFGQLLTLGEMRIACIHFFPCTLTPRIMNHQILNLSFI